MKKIVMSLIVVFVMIGCNQKSLKPETTESSYTHSVILGTYLWDVESNSLKSSHNSDFWWEHVNNEKKNLVPKNGTLVAIVDNSLDEIDKEFIANYPFQGGKIDGKDLPVGTVLIFKTAEGNAGKMEVIGYKSLQDFNFPEAEEYLTEDWKHHVLNQEDREGYNLEVKYKLYK